MFNLVIVNNPKKDWPLNIANVDVVAAKSYLTDSKFSELRNVRVYNLCHSYSYQSVGYYVSLLAEARGHKIFPSVSTIQNLKIPIVSRVISDDIEDLMQSSLRKIKSDHFTFNIYFGRSVAEQYTKLSQQLYNLFQAPLLQAKFTFNEKWLLQSITPLSLAEIGEAHLPYVTEFAVQYFAKKRLKPLKKALSIYNLTILYDPKEKNSPSNQRAINHFEDAAESIGLSVEIIGKDDFSALAEFDALFIRDTTSVNHYTYRFAQRAKAEGLVVVDDPASIVKCTNKVYLAELMLKSNIPRPKTLIIHQDNRDIVANVLGLPCVLKQPDSSFSKGVVKARDEAELQKFLDKFLDDSDLIIAQEFMPTDFDWRIGVLDKQPLFACKYFMAEGHWQIYNWGKGVKTDRYGDFATLPLDKVPEKVIKTAVRAANLIGDGFYGVDLKESNGRIYVVEINDNPSVDAGVEDLVLKDQLYLTIMQSILRRIKAQKATKL